MLRITVVESSRRAVNLRVEGRIAGSWVEELRKACETHMSEDGDVQLSLELADVSFVDGAGIVLLKQLRTGGVSFLRINPYLAEQLRDGTQPDGI